MMVAAVELIQVSCLLLTYDRTPSGGIDGV
jgi:hypothetical protein